MVSMIGASLVFDTVNWKVVRAEAIDLCFLDDDERCLPYEIIRRGYGKRLPEI